MDSAVSHENEKPIYYKRDLFFTRLVVDKVKVDMMGHQLDYTVYYAGTSEWICLNNMLNFVSDFLLVSFLAFFIDDFNGLRPGVELWDAFMTLFYCSN